MKKKQILVNAMTSFGQVLVVGASLFFLYRYLLQTIGVEQLGIWSVVLAMSSTASIIRKGISGSAVKYVAQYLARGEEETVVKVVQTTAISIAVFAGAALFLTYPVIKWILGLVLPADRLGLAIAVLPYALLSFWLLLVGSSYYAALDGYQRTDLRSWTLMISSVLLLMLAYVLVPSHGLMGLACAQVAQSAFVLVFSWMLLKVRLRALPVVPYRWDRGLFKEMVGYAFNLQVINILQTLTEPLTKALLTKFGGVAMTGYYEMASRMVVQFRSLIVSANQVMVPTIADLHEKGLDILQDVYRKSYRLILYVSLPFFSIIAILTPSISYIWIGHYESSFVIFAYILISGWFINTMISPSYFSNLGVGEVKWNTMGHIVIAILNVVLCFGLGSLFSGTGVVVGWVVALDIGSLLITYLYHKRYVISFSELFPKDYVLLAIASVLGLVASFSAHYFLLNKVNILINTGGMVCIYVCFVVGPLWFHPMRKILSDWACSAFFEYRRV